MLRYWFVDVECVDLLFPCEFIACVIQGMIGIAEAEEVVVETLVAAEVVAVVLVGEVVDIVVVVI